MTAWVLTSPLGNGLTTNVVRPATPWRLACAPGGNPAARWRRGWLLALLVGHGLALHGWLARDLSTPVAQAASAPLAVSWLAAPRVSEPEPEPVLPAPAPATEQSVIASEHSTSRLHLPKPSRNQTHQSPPIPAQAKPVARKTPAKPRPRPKPLPPHQAKPVAVKPAKPASAQAASPHAASTQAANTPAANGQPLGRAQAAPALTQARFDAAYLNNPAPTYPPFSLRLHEEGRVLLRVNVSAAGGALAVQLAQSSGHPRLDKAAREAVTRWRFVPASRGGEPIDAWVLVPIHFSLQGA